MTVFFSELFYIIEHFIFFSFFNVCLAVFFKESVRNLKYILILIKFSVILNMKVLHKQLKSLRVQHKQLI